ncbi:hypothetical protein WN943_026247 [Citrus x changshan-huyou]
MRNPNGTKSSKEKEGNTTDPVERWQELVKLWVSNSAKDQALHSPCRNRIPVHSAKKLSNNYTICSEAKVLVVRSGLPKTHILSASITSVHGLISHPHTEDFVQVTCLLLVQVASVKSISIEEAHRINDRGIGILQSPFTPMVKQDSNRGLIKESLEDLVECNGNKLDQRCFNMFEASTWNILFKHGQA